MAWRLYNDAACTQVFSGILTTTHRQNLSDNPQDFTLYFANIEDDPLNSGYLKLQDGTNPGVDNIEIYIEDLDPGQGHEATEITLGLTAADLSTNTPGAPLSLGPQLISGIGNVRPIHIRIINTVTTLGSSQELSVWIKPTVVTAV